MILLLYALLDLDFVFCTIGGEYEIYYIDVNIIVITKHFCKDQSYRGNRQFRALDHHR